MPNSEFNQKYENKNIISKPVTSYTFFNFQATFCQSKIEWQKGNG